MSHDEIRNIILKSLYPTYYGTALGRSVITDEFLKTVFPLQKDFSNIYPELDYLNKKFLIKGEWAGGDKYLRWIRITESGIDRVEQFDEELCNLHYQRRIKIIKWLYDSYFQKDHNKPFEITQILSEIGLENSDETYKEFEYLESKGLIEGFKQLGPRSLSWIKITEHGIDIVEQIASNIIQKISEEITTGEIKQELEKIRNEQSTSSKTSKVLELITKFQPLIDIGIQIAQVFIGGG